MAENKQGLVFISCGQFRGEELAPRQGSRANNENLYYMVWENQ
jgi:hypothetical protein